MKISGCVLNPGESPRKCLEMKEGGEIEVCEKQTKRVKQDCLHWVREQVVCPVDNRERLGALTSSDLHIRTVALPSKDESERR